VTQEERIRILLMDIGANDGPGGLFCGSVHFTEKLPIGRIINPGSGYGLGRPVQATVKENTDVACPTDAGAGRHESVHRHGRRTSQSRPPLSVILWNRGWRNFTWFGKLQDSACDRWGRAGDPDRRWSLLKRD